MQTLDRADLQTPDTITSDGTGADKPTIAVIVGSTRPNRFAEYPARWIAERLLARGDVTLRYLDLRDFPMPLFDEPHSPAMAGEQPFANEAVARWTAEIAAADAFVIVTPEYNHSFSAVLKNALDYVFHEWNRKPVAFVSYSGTGGVRPVEQLRLVAIELRMAPIQAAVHLPLSVLAAHYTGGDVAAELETQNAVGDQMLDELLWWTRALNRARAESTTALSAAAD